MPHEHHIETPEQWRSLSIDGIAVRASALDRVDESDMATIQALHQLGDSITSAALFDPDQPAERWPRMKQVQAELEALYTAERERFEPIRRRLQASSGSMRLTDRLHRSPRTLHLHNMPEDPNTRELDYFYLLLATEACSAIWGNYVTTAQSPRSITDVWLWIEHAVQEARAMFIRAQQSRGEDQPPAAIPFPSPPSPQRPA